MTFIKGQLCELRVLQETEQEARTWADAVMGSVTLEYTLTGSIPMKWMDIREEWTRERQLGAMIFGIYRRGKMVGTSGLYRAYPVYRSYEFRIIIFDRDSVGKGVGTEVTWLVTDYGFRALNAHRIWLGCHEDNTGAWRVYENVGYKFEGFLRDEIYCYGKYANAKRYSMLRAEWEKLCGLRGIETTGSLRKLSTPKGREEHSVQALCSRKLSKAVPRKD